MIATFLSAQTRLTKRYTFHSGVLTKEPYPLVWEFTSHEETYRTLPELAELLKKHAALGHCMLKGSIAQPLHNQSRAGSTTATDPTQLLVLDLDGLPDTLTVDFFLKEMGLAEYSYIVQWSASYGIESKSVRAHLFLLIDKPVAAPLIKQWLIQKNHEVPMLQQSLKLTKNGNTLSWTLDISACQNDKLIYIAPPTLKGIKDPLRGKNRIEYVKRKKEIVPFSTYRTNTVTKNRELTHAAIKQLREAAGLPVKKPSYKMVGSTEVMLNPDESVITEMKSERGFVYFNLNGGDSWAYYHPENNPTYILNFKGEPAYLTKDLLPEYWEQLNKNPNSTRTSSSGKTYLAFLDRKTSTYWRGTYDPNADNLDITAAKNETQLRHFCKQYGVPIGDFVPEWELIFDPQDVVRVDVQNRVVNLFQPTPYMLNVSERSPRDIPKVIKKVIHNALGDDKETIDHFVNWLATIVQTRDRTRTAWVLHGTQGTGKGILTNDIIRPLFGNHTAVKRMETLEEKYNSYMESVFFVFVDEVQARALQNERGVMAKMKNFITEPLIPVRALYSNEHYITNYTNWILMSNMPDPVSIPKDDRRYNVGRYQTKKLKISANEIAQIEKELQAFYNYLANYPADYEQAGTVLESADRDTLISISSSSIEDVSDALNNGNFRFFVDLLPAGTAHLRSALRTNQIEDFREVLKTLITRTLPNGSCSISREELRTLFDFAVGNIPQSPNKFSSLLKHYRLHISPVWLDGKTVRGINVVWQDHSSFAQYTKDYVNPSTQTKPSKAPRAAKKTKGTV